MPTYAYIEQDPLRLDMDDTVIEYTGDPIMLKVKGGSGTGNFLWKIKCTSGEAVFTGGYFETLTTDPQVSIEFNKYGKIQVSVYREDSRIYEDIYIQSKTLEFELTLDAKIVKLEVSPQHSTYLTGRFPSSNPVDMGFIVIHPNITDSEYSEIFRPVGPELYVPPIDLHQVWYKFDVLSKSTYLNGYDNGVRYTQNNDGSWTIVGNPIGSSVYNLIVSDNSVPNYLKTNRYYYFNTSPFNISPLKFVISLIYSNEDKIIYELNYPTLIAVPKYLNDALLSGFVVSLKVSSKIDTKVSLRLIDGEPYKVSANLGDKYSIAVTKREIKPAYENKYNKDIKYKSGELKIDSSEKYSIITTTTPLDKHNIKFIGLLSKYDPLVDVIFTIQADSDSYFNDGWVDGNTYRPFTRDGTNQHSPWDDLWVGEDVKLCLGYGGPPDNPAHSPVGLDFYFSSHSDDVIEEHSVPFCRISAEMKDGYVQKGTYWIKMPAYDVRLHLDSIVKYPESEFSHELNPYSDVQYLESGDPIESNVVYLRDESYMNAIKFCYYSKDHYFSDEDYYPEPLLTSPWLNPDGSALVNTFYRYYPSSLLYTLDRFLNRIDIIYSLRRISKHVCRYNDETDWIVYNTDVTASKLIAQNPDDYLNSKFISTNSPKSSSSYFAGYPLGLSYKDYKYNIRYPVDPSLPSIEFTNRSVPNVLISGDPDTVESAWTRVIIRTSQSYRGAISDFLSNVRNIPDLSWGSWVGSIIQPEGYVSSNFNAFGTVDYHEAFQLLWNFAKFKQLDILDTVSSVSSEGMVDEFKADPCCMWALSRGLTTGFRAPLSLKFSDSPSDVYNVPANSPIYPGQKVDRSEWAYIIQQFCIKYAW